VPDQEIPKMVIDRLLDQQQQTLERYSHLVDGLDDAIAEIAAQLDTLATADAIRANNTQCCKQHEGIQNTLRYILMVVAVIGTFGIGTYVWISKDVDARVATQIKKKIEEEQVKQHARQICFTDERGQKKCYYLE